MNEEAIKQSAGILALTRVRNQKIDALPEEYRPSDEAEAYAVQERLHSLLDEAGYGKRVGYKIGCTTPVMQRFLGISNPCAGGVFNTSTSYIATTVEFEKYSHPGVECEIAAFIGQDLVPGGGPFNRESVAPAVSALFGAIEIVDDRWTDYKAVDTPSLIADDFFASGIVLSQPTPAKDAPDLANAIGLAHRPGHDWRHSWTPLRSAGVAGQFAGGAGQTPTGGRGRDAGQRCRNAVGDPR